MEGIEVEKWEKEGIVYLRVKVLRKIPKDEEMRKRWESEYQELIGKLGLRDRVVFVYFDAYFDGDFKEEEIEALLNPIVEEVGNWLKVQLIFNDSTLHLFFY